MTDGKFAHAYILISVAVINIVNGNMGSIIRNIRKAHKGNSACALDTTAAKEINAVFEKDDSFKDSLQETRVVVVCQQLSITKPAQGKIH